MRWLNKEEVPVCSTSYAAALKGKEVRWLAADKVQTSLNNARSDFMSQENVNKRNKIERR